MKPIFNQGFKMVLIACCYYIGVLPLSPLFQLYLPPTYVVVDMNGLLKYDEVEMRLRKHLDSFVCFNDCGFKVSRSRSTSVLYLLISNT